MKHLKTCIAVSLDGFIARKDNDLDWMLENVKKEISAAYEPVSYTHLRRKSQYSGLLLKLSIKRKMKS